jgi:hypothetical protein
MPNVPDPETKAKSNKLDFALVLLLLVVLGGVVFQLFLRYAYVHTAGNTVVRIDRISGDSCVLPCDENGYGPRTVAYMPPPTPVPAKVCHPANVVRVTKALRPPVGRTPTPYAEGGPRAIAFAHVHHRVHRKKPGPPPIDPRLVQNAVELTDGHVYSFSRDVFAADVTTWTTGQDVQVCATHSKLEDRPYYSVGATDDAEPATLAL